MDTSAIDTSAIDTSAIDTSAIDTVSEVGQATQASPDLIKVDLESTGPVTSTEWARAHRPVHVTAHLNFALDTSGKVWDAMASFEYHLTSLHQRPIVVSHGLGTVTDVCPETFARDFLEAHPEFRLVRLDAS
jgi:hypothetical protein